MSLSSPQHRFIRLGRGRGVGQQGFTLIELVMVIVLVGVLAVVVVPRMDIFNSVNEVGYRDKVRGALEFARKAAVSGRRSVQVTLAGNNLTFSVDNVETGGVGAGTYPRDLTLPAADRTCGGATNQVCAPTGVALAGPATLAFNPLGQPSAEGVYTVTGTAAWTITVEAETGYVH